MTQKITIGFISLFAALATAGCASTSSNIAPDQLENPVTESPTVAIDPEISRTSSALHSFLAGQLDYVQADFDGATKNLLRSSKLSRKSVPILGKQLTDLLIRAGDLDRALVEASKVVAAEPANTESALLKAGILDALGHKGEAKALYLNLARQHPDLLDAHVLYGGFSASREGAQSGIDILKPFVQRGSKSALAHYVLALLQELHGELSEARQSYRGIIDINPENRAVNYDILRVLLKSRSLGDAQRLSRELASDQTNRLLQEKTLLAFAEGKLSVDQLLAKLESVSPSRVEISDLRFRLATAHIQEQKFDAAVRELTLMIAKDPENDIARYYRASIYGGIGQRKEALRDLKFIEPDAEMYVKARSFAAVLHRQDNDLKGAEREVRAALSVAPENGPLISYLVTILKEQERLADARALLERELKRSPNNERLLFDYAVLHADLGAEDKAIAVMMQLLELNPRNGDALNYIAYTYAEKGDNLEEAERLAKQALAVSPTDGFYLDTLGWVYFKQKRFKESAEILKQAVDQGHGDPVIAEHYGDVLVELSKFSEAVDIYRMAVEKLQDEANTDREFKKNHDRLQMKLKGLQDRLSDRPAK